MPKKECAVPKCGDPIPDWALMCIRHWRRLPKELQRGVNVTLREYKANMTVETAKAYRDAVAAAVAHFESPPALAL